MASIEGLKREIEACNCLITNVNNAKSALEKAYDALLPATEIGNYYKIDDIKADNGQIEKERQKISYLIGNMDSMVSSINSEISDLEDEIEELEREEEEKALKQAKSHSGKK